MNDNKLLRINPFTDAAQDREYTLGRVPNPILGSIDSTITLSSQASKPNKQLGLQLIFDMGNLYLQDNLITNQRKKLTNFKKGNEWSILTEVLIKSTRNNPTNPRTMTRDLLRKNTVSRDNKEAYLLLDNSIEKLDKYWVYVQNNLMPNELLELFRVKTVGNLRFKFRSAVTSEELLQLPREDYRNIVNILKNKSEIINPLIRS